MKLEFPSSVHGFDHRAQARNESGEVVEILETDSLWELIKFIGRLAFK